MKAIKFFISTIIAILLFTNCGSAKINETNNTYVTFNDSSVTFTTTPKETFYRSIINTLNPKDPLLKSIELAKIFDFTIYTNSTKRKKITPKQARERAKTKTIYIDVPNGTTLSINEKDGIYEKTEPGKKKEKIITKPSK